MEKAGFVRRLFDDVSARAYLQDHFEPEHLSAFDRCPHPAMRCDYFRLCFLVASGGVYVDVDEVYLGAPLDALLSDDRLKLQPLCYDLLKRSMVQWSHVQPERSSSDESIFYVNNNPIVAPPRHPVLVLALHRATEMVLGEASSQMRDIQSLTGPGNLTAALVAFSIASDDSLPGQVVLLNDWDRVISTEWQLEYRNDVRNWRTWSRRGSNALTGDDLALLGSTGGVG